MIRENYVLLEVAFSLLFEFICIAKLLRRLKDQSPKTHLSDKEIIHNLNNRRRKWNDLSNPCTDESIRKERVHKKNGHVTMSINVMCLEISVMLLSIRIPVIFTFEPSG